MAGRDPHPCPVEPDAAQAEPLRAGHVELQVVADHGHLGPRGQTEGGERAASNLLQAAPQIDAVWNHDDDQGVGVKAAFDNAGRDEFAFIGGAGSANAMRWIQEGEMEATVIYPPTQAADGVRLARLIAQDKGLSDLVQVEVPKRIVLNAPVVNADNVEDYLPLGFES